MYETTHRPLFFFDFQNKSMQPQLIAVPPTTTIIQVDREMYSRGNIFAGCDICRRQYLILSQRLCHTSEAIQDLAGEDAPVSSLYECAQRRTRKGRIGSFSIIKLAQGEAPAWIEANRNRYDEMFINTAQPSKWILTRPDKYTPETTTRTLGD